MSTGFVFGMNIWYVDWYVEPVEIEDPIGLVPEVPEVPLEPLPDELIVITFPLVSTARIADAVPGNAPEPVYEGRCNEPDDARVPSKIAGPIFVKVPEPDIVKLPVKV